MIVEKPSGRAVRRDLVQCVDAAGHGVNAGRKAALLAELTVQRPRLRVDAGIMDAGKADGRHDFQGLLQRCFRLRIGRRRNLVADENRCAVDEHAGRIAIRIAFDASALRILGRRRHAARLQRGTVRPAGMPVDALQPDGPVRHDRIQLRRGRESAEFPAHLVPAAAQYPRQIGIGLGVLRDLGERLIEAFRLRKIELQGLEAETHHVPVRIDETGEQGLAARVDHVSLGRSFAVFQRALDPPIIADHQPGELGQSAEIVERIAVGVDDDGAGVCRPRDEDRCRDCQYAHDYPLYLRIRDDVSWRAPPSF